MNRWRPLLIALSLSSTLLVPGALTVLLAQEAAQEPAPKQFKFSLLGKPLPELKLEEGDRWFHATKGLSGIGARQAAAGRLYDPWLRELCSGIAQPGQVAARSGTRVLIDADRLQLLVQAT